MLVQIVHSARCLAAGVGGAPAWAGPASALEEEHLWPTSIEALVH